MSYHNLSSDYGDDDYGKKLNINVNTNEYQGFASGRQYPSISNEYIDDDNYEYITNNLTPASNNSPHLLLAQQKQRMSLAAAQQEDERKNRQIQNDVSESKKIIYKKNNSLFLKD